MSLDIAHRPLRVWLPTLRAGTGADVFAERLAEGLARAGHQPLLQWFPPRFELMPWRLRNVPLPVGGVDVVHASSWLAFAFRRPGLPLVVTEHHYVADPAFAPYRGVAQALYHRCLIGLWLALSYRAADVLVAVSQHTADAMRSRVGRPVSVVYNWVDLERFRPAAHLNERGASAPFRLLFVGNPSRRKGADVLPRLATLLGDRFELLCLGGLRDGFEARHAPPNLQRLARVTSAAMPGVYPLADAVLVPTRYEAFGYVALEAMACGLPVVGFDSTGTREVCQNEVTALLAPIDDLEELAARCRRLADDPALGGRLGQAGRSRAEELFSPAQGIMAYVAAYRAAMTAHGAR